MEKPTLQHCRTVIGWYLGGPPARTLGPHEARKGFEAIREQFFTLAQEGRLAELAPSQAPNAIPALYSRRLLRLLEGDTVTEIAKSEGVVSESVRYIARYALRRMAELPPR